MKIICWVCHTISRMSFHMPCNFHRQLAQSLMQISKKNADWRGKIVSVRLFYVLSFVQEQQLSVGLRWISWSQSGWTSCIMFEGACERGYVIVSNDWCERFGILWAEFLMLLLGRVPVGFSWRHKLACFDLYHVVKVACNRVWSEEEDIYPCCWVMQEAL